MKRIDVEDRPHLALFAVRDINTGEELRYDYGETSKYLPWRRKSKITNILVCINSIAFYATVCYKTASIFIVNLLFINNMFKE